MSIRETLLELGIRPSKGLGQNFLVHPDTARKIADALPPAAPTAVEIGPGLGALTSALLEKNIDVHAVEIDGRLAQFLSRRFSGDAGRFHLVQGDARDIDWPSMLAASRPPRVVFGNLPYSTAARLLEVVIRNAGLFSEAVLCLQKEVAERILSPGGRSMGSVTLLTHRFCSRREKLFDIPPGGFIPKPNVSSTVFRLVFRPGVTWSERDRRVPRLLFSARRKKLSAVVPPETLIASGKNLADRRIDELSVDEAGRLADLL